MRYLCKSILLAVHTILLVGSVCCSTDVHNTDDKYALIHVSAHDEQSLHLIKQLQLNDFKYDVSFLEEIFFEKRKFCKYTYKS